MGNTIKIKLFSLSILLVLITSISISIPYYYLTKQDTRADSQVRIEVAFEIIRNDIEKRIQDKSQRIGELLQQVSAIPWQLTWYGETADKAAFFLSPTYSSYISTIGEEFVQFSKFISASRLSLYTADKRLLISYHNDQDDDDEEFEEHVDAYVINQQNQNTLMPVGEYSRLLIKGEPLPELPVHAGLETRLSMDIPDSMLSEHFLDNGRLGLRITFPIYNYSKNVGENVEKVGAIIAETFYTQAMAKEYAKLSHAEVNFFAEKQLFIGTLQSQSSLHSGDNEQIRSLFNRALIEQQANDIYSLAIDQHDYYQGVRTIINAAGQPVGDITVSLSQDIEKAKIRQVFRTILLIIVFSIVFVFGLTILLSRSTLQSINHLTTSTSEIAHGNLDRPIDTSGTDELGTLARSFSIMREAIKERLAELKNEIKQHELTNLSLQESENRYRTLFEKSADAILIIEDDKFVDCNLATVNMLGYDSKSELLGGHPSTLSPETQPDGQNSFKKMNDMMAIAFSKGSHRFEWDCVRQNGDLFPVESLFTAVPFEDRKFLHVVWRDITERKQASELLSYQASHDDLTSLVNRREFERRVETTLLASKHNNSEHALCYMDLDQFKVVNDTCGHVAGDELLRQISNLLSNSVRHSDTLARLGGDEFGVLMEYCSIDDAYQVATALLTAIQNYQFVWEGHRFKIGVSMGLVSIDGSTFTLTKLLKDVDAACYMAKELGRNRIHVFHAEDSELAKRHGEMQWVERIHHALDDDRFCLYAQPIVPLSGSDKTHYELLLRMIDDDGNNVPPNAFLPAAERYDLITDIDHWVIQHVFNLLENNPEFLQNVNFCSINLSGPSLTEPGILQFIVERIEATKVDGQKLCFEVTETAAISNLRSAAKFISTLKELGCRFALDDFGSGLSSFAYLKNLPVDYLKIDGMFVKDIVGDPIDFAMVKSINEIGNLMGMETIAEFVENDDIKLMLSQIGVDYLQGYGVGKPKRLDDLLD